MQEKTRSTRESRGAGPAGLGDIFSDDGQTGGMVTVSHGPYAESLPVSEMSVGEIRARYRDRFDIDPQSQPIVDGNLVDDETVVRVGQMLMFVRRAGEKGQSVRRGA